MHPKFLSLVLLQMPNVNDTFGAAEESSSNDHTELADKPAEPITLCQHQMPSRVELVYRPILSPETVQTYAMNHRLLVAALEVHNLGDVRSITICGGRYAFMLRGVCHIVLEQHPQLWINCEVDPLHPQVSALEKLDLVARYPVEQAKLDRDEISATGRLLACFPECLVI